MRPTYRSDCDILREIERRAESGAYVPMLVETHLVHAAVALSGDDVTESERLVRSARSPSATERAGTMDDLVEPLSPRRIEILACISRELSNEEAGQGLFISAGTVKWHMANTFGRLDVRNRTCAAAVVRELGLFG